MLLRVKRVDAIYAARICGNAFVGASTKAQNRFEKNDQARPTGVDHTGFAKDRELIGRPVERAVCGAHDRVAER